MRLTCLLILSVATAAFSQTAAELVEPRLIADHTAISPGGTFRLGVLYTIKPHWHIYWKNPGDAGKPTEIRFQLPPGFAAGELQWPVARRFPQPGDLVGYGYENEVLLWADVTAPKDLTPGSMVKLAATTDYLVCQQSCLEGQARVDLSLSVADKPVSAPAVFDEWAKKLPAANSEKVKSIRTEGALADGNARAPFTIEIQWHEPPKEIAFLPVVGDALDVSDIDIATGGNQTTVKFRAKLLRGKTLPENPTMESVLTISGGVGVRINVPLKNLPK